MKVQINPVTGNQEITTSAKLLTISENPLENKNGTPYYPATIDVVTASGEIKTVPALIYQANYEYGMEADKSYLCTVTKTDRGHLFTLSHLAARDMTTDDDFGFNEVTNEVEVEVAEGEDEGTF